MDTRSSSSLQILYSHILYTLIILETTNTYSSLLVMAIASIHFHQICLLYPISRVLKYRLHSSKEVILTLFFRKLLPYCLTDSNFPKRIPLHLQDYSLCLLLYCCPANGLISAIFLDSTYMC